MSRLPDRQPSRSRAALLAACAATLCLAAAPQPAEAPAGSGDAWLDEVALLLSEREREVYSMLGRDYQRRLFIERFWQVRDPFPDTVRNEFRDTWEHRLAEARHRYRGLDDPRAEALLLAGPPDRRVATLCPQMLRPVDVWLYGRSARIRREFSLVFAVRGRGYRLWSPLEGLMSLLDFAAGGPTGSAAATAELLRRECPAGDDVVAILGVAVDRRQLIDQLALVPRPGDEWVETFLARTTDLPDGADTFAAEVKFHFPGRRQSRTTVQGLITVPQAEALAGDAGGANTYNFSVEGEVLRGRELFDSFRYRFDMPAGEAPDGVLPLVVQRHLRPGEYTVILRIEDRNSGRYHRAEHQLDVPRLEQHQPLEALPASAAAAAARPLVSAATARLEQILSEAQLGEGGGEDIVRLLPPPFGLHTGKLRVEAAAIGERISKVRFHLNGRPILAKTRPPYSVELDLGRSPRRHRVEALAVDETGEVVARDRITLNSGPHSFEVRLLEPQPGKRYHQSLTALAEVDLPANERLDRVELYLNERLLATLYQQPFVQPIVLPHDEEISYVKAVAYLEDGHSDQDIVFINTPRQLDQLEIQFVELYTTVVDKRGRPVEGLSADSFRVLEDGIEQRLRRLERVTDLPISAGIVLDTSTSMVEELDDAEQAAQQFFDRVLRPKDRAAVLVFNDTWQLKVPLTNEPEVLAGGLSGLSAEGETALYDSLVFALYYFAGLRGKRAVILLTDGEDSSSRYRFDETLEFAKRSGVAIYAIGIDLSPRDFEVLSKLRRLAFETGGECFTISRTSELERIYERIEQELRTQYVLAYQSSQVGGDTYRRVEVQLARPGLRAKTVPGYYP